ncbi:DUF6876 family protein [Chryseobacterium indologenes]|uniref:DUF6876 family protein n=1 Tax=Chryseobacterium indologenes TaxID=253 RepID=UPI0021A725FE|nr:hypothetical protein [Elizabethkingia anophelis]
MTRKGRIENNANDLYDEFPEANVFIKYSKNNYISEGLLYVADQEECHWFLDIVIEDQKLLKSIDYQKWNLTKESEMEFVVVVLDKHDNILLQRTIQAKSFYFSIFNILKINDNLLLPCEE